MMIACDQTRAATLLVLTIALILGDFLGRDIVHGKMTNMRRSVQGLVNVSGRTGSDDNAKVYR
jgi:hypothetical protein